MSTESGTGKADRNGKADRDGKATDQADQSQADQSQAGSQPPRSAARGRLPRPVRRFVTVHGYRRSYVRAGRGSVVLLVHGIGDSSQTWNELIPELARHRTVIAPDLLGHGESDKPRADYSIAGYACAMRDLLTVLGIERATVVGHSLGGGVAMQFAYQFPERCERLVLVATGGVGPDLHPLLRLAALPGSGAVLPLVTAPAVVKAGWAAARTLGWFHSDVGRDADDLLRTFQSLHVSTARRAFLRTLRTSVDGRGQAITMLDRCYLAAGMPSMIVWGDHDAVIPVEHARMAHAAMPGSRLEIFAGAGHFPHRSDPDRFRAVLMDFLATTRPASHSTRQWRSLLRAGRFTSVTTSRAGGAGSATGGPSSSDGSAGTAVPGGTAELDGSTVADGTAETSSKSPRAEVRGRGELLGRRRSDSSDG